MISLILQSCVILCHARINFTSAELLPQWINGRASVTSTKLITVLIDVHKLNDSQNIPIWICSDLVPCVYPSSSLALVKLEYFSETYISGMCRCHIRFPDYFWDSAGSYTVNIKLNTEKDPSTQQFICSNSKFPYLGPPDGNTLPLRIDRHSPRSGLTYYAVFALSIVTIFTLAFVSMFISKHKELVGVLDIVTSIDGYSSYDHPGAQLAASFQAEYGHRRSYGKTQHSSEKYNVYQRVLNEYKSRMTTLLAQVYFYLRPESLRTHISTFISRWHKSRLEGAADTSVHGSMEDFLITNDSIQLPTRTHAGVHMSPAPVLRDLSNHETTTKRARSLPHGSLQTCGAAEGSLDDLLSDDISAPVSLPRVELPILRLNMPQSPKSTTHTQQPAREYAGHDRHIHFGQTEPNVTSPLCKLSPCDQSLDQTVITSVTVGDRIADDAFTELLHPFGILGAEDKVSRISSAYRRIPTSITGVASAHTSTFSRTSWTADVISSHNVGRRITAAKTSGSITEGDGAHLSGRQIPHTAESSSHEQDETVSEPLNSLEDSSVYANQQHHEVNVVPYLGLDIKRFLEKKESQQGDNADNLCVKSAATSATGTLTLSLAPHDDVTTDIAAPFAHSVNHSAKLSVIDMLKHAKSFGSTTQLRISPKALHLKHTYEGKALGRLPRLTQSHADISIRETQRPISYRAARTPTHEEPDATLSTVKSSLREASSHMDSHGASRQSLSAVLVHYGSNLAFSYLEDFPFTIRMYRPDMSTVQTYYRNSVVYLNYLPFSLWTIDKTIRQMCHIERLTNSGSKSSNFLTIRGYFLVESSANSDRMPLVPVGDVLSAKLNPNMRYLVYVVTERPYNYYTIDQLFVFADSVVEQSYSGYSFMRKFYNGVLPSSVTSANESSDSDTMRPSRSSTLELVHPSTKSSAVSAAGDSSHALSVLCGHSVGLSWKSLECTTADSAMASATGSNKTTIYSLADNLLDKDVAYPLFNFLSDHDIVSVIPSETYPIKSSGVDQSSEGKLTSAEGLRGSRQSDTTGGHYGSFQQDALPTFLALNPHNHGSYSPSSKAHARPGAYLDRIHQSFEDRHNSVKLPTCSANAASLQPMTLSANQCFIGVSAADLRAGPSSVTTAGSAVPVSTTHIITPESGQYAHAASSGKLRWDSGRIACNASAVNLYTHQSSCPVSEPQQELLGQKAYTDTSKAESRFEVPLIMQRPFYYLFAMQRLKKEYRSAIAQRTLMACAMSSQGECSLLQSGLQAAAVSGTNRDEPYSTTGSSDLDGVEERRQVIDQIPNDAPAISLIRKESFEVIDHCRLSADPRTVGHPVTSPTVMPETELPPYPPILSVPDQTIKHGSNIESRRLSVNTGHQESYSEATLGVAYSSAGILPGGRRRTKNSDSSHLMNIDAIPKLSSECKSLRRGKRHSLRSQLKEDTRTDGCPTSSTASIPRMSFRGRTSSIVLKQPHCEIGTSFKKVPRSKVERHLQTVSDSGKTEEPHTSVKGRSSASDSTSHNEPNLSGIRSKQPVDASKDARILASNSLQAIAHRSTFSSASDNPSKIASHRDTPRGYGVCMGGSFITVTPLEAYDQDHLTSPQFQRAVCIDPALSSFAPPSKDRYYVPSHEMSANSSMRHRILQYDTDNSLFTSDYRSSKDGRTGKPEACNAQPLSSTSYITVPTHSSQSMVREFENMFDAFFRAGSIFRLRVAALILRRLVVVLDAIDCVIPFIDRDCFAFSIEYDPIDGKLSGQVLISPYALLCRRLNMIPQSVLLRDEKLSEGSKCELGQRILILLVELVTMGPATCSLIKSMVEFGQHLMPSQDRNSKSIREFISLLHLFFNDSSMVSFRFPDTYASMKLYLDELC